MSYSNSLFCKGGGYRLGRMPQSPWTLKIATRTTTISIMTKYRIAVSRYARFAVLMGENLVGQVTPILYDESSKKGHTAET